MKITIIGDITTDRPLLNASRKKAGDYDFSSVFSDCKELFSEADYVLANLETNCAGSTDDYKNEFFVCNSPDILVKNMADAGIDFVTTANNHCLDKGIDGMIRTLDVLDANGVEHTGTFRNRKEREDIKTIEVSGVKIAILAYTYGTNESNTGIVLDEANDYHVGLLRPQRGQVAGSGLKQKLVGILTADQRRKIKRIINRTKLKFGISYFKPVTDRIAEGDTDSKYLDSIRSEITRAKEKADVVIVCPHMGGQFNPLPGDYSEYIVRYLIDSGADVVAGNHPHTVQKAEVQADDDIKKIVAYAIGGYNLSTSADYIVREALPEFSMALHIYIDEDKKKIEKATYSILVNTEDANHSISIIPLDEYCKGVAEIETSEFYSNAKAIYERISDKDGDFAIRREYAV